MTKAEAFIYNSPLWEYDFTYDKQRHDGTDYPVRVYIRSKSGVITHRLDCDSYMGDSILHTPHPDPESPIVWDVVKDVEVTYDTDLADLI